MRDLQKTETYLQTNEYSPRISPRAQANELAAWILAGRPPPFFVRLAHKCSSPQPFNASPVACYSLHFQIAISLLFLNKLYF